MRGKAYHEAYRDRGLSDPTCQACDWRDEIAAGIAALRGEEEGKCRR